MKLRYLNSRGHKAIFLFCLCITAVIFLPALVKAQTVADIFLLDSVSVKPYDVLAYTTWFEDPSGRLTVEQVSSEEYESRFHRNPVARGVTANQGGVLWLRLRVHNSASQTEPVFLDIQTRADTLTIYRKTENGFEARFHGDMLKASAQSFPEGMYYIGAGDTAEFYARSAKDDYALFTIQHSLLYTQPAYISSFTPQRTNWWFNGLYSGMTLLMGVYGLALFIIFRSRAYLWLMIAQVSNLLYFFQMTGVGAGLFYAELPFINKYAAGMLLSNTVVVFNFLFGIHFLRFKIYFPRTAKYLWWAVIFYCAVDYIATFLVSREFAMNTRSYMLTIIMLWIFGLVFYQAFVLKLRSAKIMVWANILMISAGIFLNLVMVGVIPMNTIYALNVLQASFMLQIVVWTMAIIDRVILLRKDREKLARRELELAHENEKLILRQNEMLEQKVEERTRELRESQQQLVQQEKLASLGQLTAGIAHEIKNPLNFVNNFADISNELIGEMETVADEAARKELLDTIRSNLKKINEHGKRADRIVKNMLEHSRSGSADKQLTDINLLCDEYTNLAYHGMRANMKGFNCAIEKNFATGLPAFSIVQQDISRVILNILNNAFYAVKDTPDGKVSVSTISDNGLIVIKVKDNGAGMPEHVKQKIFEPFFTTKPSGSGTGLGLSLSFDIIQAHGGYIRVHSEEGRGTEFVIGLPEG